MRILVCGGRDFRGPGMGEFMRDTLADLRLVSHGVTIIHGGARGADTMAGEFARYFGWDVEVYPANWLKHGNGAGPRRNQRMIDEGKPDLVIAFPGGKGTADMVRRATKAGIPVREVKP